MRSVIKKLSLIIAIGGPGITIVACGDVTGTTAKAASGAGVQPAVAAVSVAMSSPSLHVGQTTQATATVRDQNGTVLTGRAVTWSSSNPAVATVSATGSVTAVAVGTTNITATSGGIGGTAVLTVTSASAPPTAPSPPSQSLGCANPQPAWLWCDDFEQDRTSSYFEYTNPGSSFTRQPGAGLNGSTGMRATWTAGQVDAGSLKIAFGRTPTSYMRPVDAGTANYREIFWRIYVRPETGWRPNGNDKFTRAIVFAKSDWSEAAVGHVWGGSGATSQNYYVLDPVRGTDPSGTLLTSGYNDFAHFTWLGAVQGQTPLLGSGAGQWYCVEAHMRLNDPGQSNGVLEEWINGTLDAQATGLNFLGSYNAYGINALFLENYINNGAPQAQVRDYDEYVVSTQRIGCLGQSSSPPPGPAPSPPPPPSSTGAPAPGPSSTILLDTRQSLQQATTLDQAWALFPGSEHTGARPAVNGSGWSFTTNFDGHGTHALRADWAAYPQGDQGIRIISYFSAPKPHEVYYQFKGYLGKNPADPDGNGSDNTFPLYPQSNSVKRFLQLRDGVGGGATDRVDYVWTRTNPSAARVQSDNLNWGFNSSPDIWAPNNYLGRPYTTTIYFKTSSANGVPDAIYRIWIDSTLVLNATNVMLDAYAIDRWQFPDTSHNFPIPASEYFWDFLVWTP